MHAPAVLAKRIGAAHINCMTKTLLSIGHGYSARALSTALQAEGGWRVIGTTRSEGNADAVRASGAEPHVWPGHDLRPALDAATHLLISAGPGEGGDPVLAEIADDIARAARIWNGRGICRRRAFMAIMMAAGSMSRHPLSRPLSAAG